MAAPLFFQQPRNFVQNWTIDGEPFAVKEAKQSEPSPRDSRPNTIRIPKTISSAAQHMLTQSHEIRQGKPFYLRRFGIWCRIGASFGETSYFDLFHPINRKTGWVANGHFIKLLKRDFLLIEPTPHEVQNMLHLQVLHYKLATAKPDPIRCPRLSVDFSESIGIESGYRSIEKDAFTVWEDLTQIPPLPIDWNQETRLSDLTPDQEKRLASLQSLFRSCYKKRLLADLRPCNVRWKDGETILLHPFEVPYNYTKYLADYLPLYLTEFSRGNEEISNYLDPREQVGSKRKKSDDPSPAIKKPFPSFL